MIIKKIQQAKNKNLHDRPNRGSPIYFNEPYELIKDIGLGKITHEEALKTITSIIQHYLMLN